MEEVDESTLVDELLLGFAPNHSSLSYTPLTVQRIWRPDPKSVWFYHVEVICANLKYPLVMTNMVIFQLVLWL